eukprot:CAMPEP_0198124684 /NCGR_PEP_ID=MMETSP1442-20131203/40617_1 /TAXON_ID= /ORGANISM="Craspedostauros australis, Strain CCMP3328" /LENGTH=150 /DNA_ID=CAMNT_0043784147 /DNA_START=220 /DNA_END=668 /DNA_ORIENTATION=-
MTLCIPYDYACSSSATGSFCLILSSVGNRIHMSFLSKDESTETRDERGDPSLAGMARTRQHHTQNQTWAALLQQTRPCPLASCGGNTGGNTGGKMIATTTLSTKSTNSNSNRKATATATATSPPTATAFSITQSHKHNMKIKMIKMINVK